MNWKETREKLQQLSGVSLPEDRKVGIDLREANLHEADLRGADLRGADLGGADLYGADLRGADLRGATLGWTSHTLLSEILWQAADTEARKMVAAWVGRRTDWCWRQFAAFQHPEREWALAVLRKWIRDGDDTPEILRS